jgi:hypothetical protein
VNAALIAPIAAGALAWLWFLARGRTSGAVKRVALRVSLLALCGGLAVLAAQRGLFVRASVGFRLAILLALVTVAVGYLYLIRFCTPCGRMVRNLKDATCPRCGAALPVHGMTTRLRRAGDDRRWSPVDKARRRRHVDDGPRP